MINTTRWFSPAYIAPNGHIIPIGNQTVVLEDAEAEAIALASVGDEVEIFVAFRDLPSWERTHR